MLTSDDIKKIRNVIREEVENEVTASKNELSADVAMSGMRVRKDIIELKDRIKSLEIRTSKNHRDVKKEIKIVVDFLDRENVHTQKRVDRIEEHLHLPPKN